MSDTTPPVAASGVDQFDDPLGGGYPASRATLVTGGPGTGMTALGAGFLNEAGHDGGLYITTRHPTATARTMLQRFGLSLEDHPITVTSLRESVAEALGDEAPELRELLDQVLSGHAPLDRLVIDGLGGLARTVADSESDTDPRSLAEGVLRTATEDMDATALVLAETPSVEPDVTLDDDLAGLESSVDGLIRCYRSRIRGDSHRFVRVVKMDGLEFDRRAIELRTGPDGPAVVPQYGRAASLHGGENSLNVGIDGLDELCGGGLVSGGGVLFRHDGHAQLEPFLGAIMASSLQREASIELVPSIHLRPTRLRSILEAFGYDLDSLLARDRLFVFDLVDAWPSGMENVFGPREELSEVQSMLAGLADRSTGPHCRIVNADAMVHVLGTADARVLRHIHGARLIESEDLLVHIQQPSAVPEAGRATYVDAAEQVLSLELSAEGRTYLSLEKSPMGDLGTSALVEPMDERPFVTVHCPGPSG